MLPSCHAALVDLQQAHLITSEERMRLRNACDVATFLSKKSPEVVSESADILRRHGYTGEASFISGTHLPMLCYTVQSGIICVHWEAVSIYNSEPLHTQPVVLPL